jgi:hypothetical protein
LRSRNGNRGCLRHRVVIVVIVLANAAYLAMLAMVFEGSRWISNWAFCMFLILHTVKPLPASCVPPSKSGDDRKTAVLGWIEPCR